MDRVIICSIGSVMTFTHEGAPSMACSIGPLEGGADVVWLSHELGVAAERLHHLVVPDVLDVPGTRSP